jgi:uncharacterized membrane protein
MGRFNKFWVALVGAILIWIEQAWGISLPHISEEFITTALAILTAIFVGIVPNQERW